MTRLDCQYSVNCSGCDAITLSYETQKDQKINTLRNLFPSLALPEIQFQSFGTHGLRSRLDFTIENNQIGLYSYLQKKILDLPECLQLSQPLQKALDQFRKISSSAVTKGSFRIRVSPDGKIGFWLDFSNQDIKHLLETRQYLESLSSMGFVEIGQRHKCLIKKPSGDLGLGQPEFHPWSESRLQGHSIQLQSTVASFTQPSHISNAWITKKIEEWCKLIHPKHVLEFGSGIGNLTFPALIHPETRLTALEFDGLSFQALKKNVENLKLSHRVQLLKGDYRKTQLDLSPFDLLLLNPARSGVGDLLKQNLKSEYLIYMSCFPETLALDTQNLNSHGYSVEEMVIVDQFPQTHHMEVLSLWRKSIS